MFAAQVRHLWKTVFIPADRTTRARGRECPDVLLVQTELHSG